MERIEIIREALASRRGEWPAISAACGIAYSTFCKMADGRIKEPAYSKVVRIVQYLESNPSSDVQNAA